MADDSLPLFSKQALQYEQMRKKPVLAVCAVCHEVYRRTRGDRGGFCCSHACSLVYLDTVTCPAKVCAHCGMTYVPNRAWQSYCSTRCRNKAEWQRVGKVIKERSRERINELQRQRIAKMSRAQRLLPGFNSRYKACIKLDELELMLMEQENTCALCGDLLTTWEIDHIEPRSLGGPTVVENLQILCAACNRGKYTSSVEDYVEHCRRVAAFASKARAAGADIPEKPAKKRGSRARY